ncbi:TlpA disulfide reductase family protein [Parabacteroides bouchesdurhonensis]|uniref:TlpA disulfide reductase family protein n=1 Tax=Parabacteroides bouchesdurhonensis TaxID=1936995 RepID=UPI000E4C6DF2|nr:TlpA disulfide reductase family protein [Parabacteroides bouchesdurhonensis]RHJ94153.1 AhpC/TSA family protein [Bacteroides sp. AM07-16]
MIKKLIYFIGILLLLSSCGDSNTYQIEGKLTNLEDQTVFAIFERDDYKVVDTVVCDKPGHFEIKQPKDGFNCVTIFFENKTRWITAYLQSESKITITGDANYPLLLEVKGGRINNKLSAMRKGITPLLKEFTDLNRMLNEKKYSNAIEEADIASRFANVNLQLSEYAMSYIKENPDEEASIVLIQLFFTDAEDTRKMDELLALLDPKIKSFYLIHELEQYSARAKRTALGAEAPGFTVKNIYGNSVSLDSFPQKYVLLTFTAPWCDMCQTEDLYLDKVATKYPKDKLDILLISLDDNQKNVRDVLKKDSIQWNLVTDSAGQATMLIDLYNVNALPRCFLIDENGKILLKTDNGGEIKQTLENLMDDE